MKKVSIKFKITLWFTIILIVIVAVTYSVIFSVDGIILKNATKNNLIEMVENNVDEIELFTDRADAGNDNDADQYIKYNGAYLEVDDDYLDTMNGMYSALYATDGTMLYGENPITANIGDLAFANSELQTINIDGTEWYVYDRQLSQNGLNDLWLRGISAYQPEHLSTTMRISLIILPALLLLAIIGGYIIVKRSLLPLYIMSAQVSRIEHGSDLKQRIKLSDGNDEIQKLADSFNQMIDRLDSSFESEKRFTADASHELRTPLSVIIAQCDFTLEESRNEEEYREALGVIRRHSDRMNMLVDEMLTFTRMESGVYSSDVQDFSALVSDVVCEMAVFRHNNISIEAKIEEGISVMGNSTLLARLVHNLIGNAYRYGKINGKTVVRLTKKEGNALLSIEDNGIGISEKDLPHVFERFYRADISRTESGTGLGLSIVQEIAHLHGGQVSVTSTENKGSIFNFILKAL